MTGDQSDEILTVLAAKVFREAGFDSTNTRALALTVSALGELLDENLRILQSNVQHCGRVNANGFDLIKTGHRMSSISMDVYDVIGVEERLQFEQLVENVEWESPLANKSEKFIHIYDFMPEFPATHTYRNTPAPETKERLESINVKNRIEQSIKSEKNMFKLFKTSGSLPPFINYLYKMNKSSE